MGVSTYVMRRVSAPAFVVVRVQTPDERFVCRLTRNTPTSGAYATCFKPSARTASSETILLQQAARVIGDERR